MMIAEEWKEEMFLYFTVTPSPAVHDMILPLHLHLNYFMVELVFLLLLVLLSLV